MGFRPHVQANGQHAARHAPLGLSETQYVGTLPELNPSPATCGIRPARARMKEGRSDGMKGMTLVEIVMALVVAAVLTAGGAAMVSKFGSKNKVRYEADRVVNDLWEL